MVIQTKNTRLTPNTLLHLPVETEEKKWFSVYTRSYQEAIVEEELNKREIPVFLPRICVWSLRKDRRKIIKKPLFPGYLFVSIKPTHENFLGIVKRKGVVNILGNSLGPVAVPSSQIKSIQILLESGQYIESLQYMKTGSRVEVVKGSLKGAVGILKEIDRNKRELIVSIDIFQRSIAVKLAPESVISIL